MPNQDDRSQQELADNAAPAVPATSNAALASRFQQMFPILSAAEIDRVRRLGEVRRFAAGELLFRAGEAFPGTYVILNGRVTIMPRDGLGQSLPVAAFERLQPHLKLVSLPLGEALSESGVVLRRVYFPTNSIVSLLYVMADGASAEIAVVCNRHHSLDQQLCRWLLLSLDRLASNELVMTQELIANMLGVRREGVIEAAGKLQHAGLIHYSRGRITVTDRGGLEARTCECYAVVKKECDRLLPDSTAA